MITNRRIKTVSELIDAVGAGNSDSQAGGPVVVAFALWTGELVTGSYVRIKDEKDIDIVSRLDIIVDDERLRHFIERMLRTGQPFTTETGSHDMVCTLKWQISSEGTLAAEIEASSGTIAPPARRIKDSH